MGSPSIVKSIVEKEDKQMKIEFGSTHVSLDESDVTAIEGRDLVEGIVECRCEANDDDTSGHLGYLWTPISRSLFTGLCQ
jgi:hypothetical protein